MPLKRLISTLTVCTIFFTLQAKPYTIMLEPSGNAKHTGREIDDSFERGLTLQCAEKLKKTLEQQFPSIRIVLSRCAAEIIEPLQNAHFANRLGVDFFLSIHLYQTTEEKPTIYLYQFAYDPITDFWSYNNQGLSFIRYDQAHKNFSLLTQSYGNQIASRLQEKNSNKFISFKGFFALPFKPLIGVHAPALALECGINKKSDWLNLIEPIAYALQSIIEQELQGYR